MNACVDCCYYEASDQDSDDNATGVCRRYAPKPYSLSEREANLGAFRYPFWPDVNASDWCGEWFPRDATT